MGAGVVLEPPPYIHAPKDSRLTSTTYLIPGTSKYAPKDITPGIDHIPHVDAYASIQGDWSD